MIRNGVSESSARNKGENDSLMNHASAGKLGRVFFPSGVVSQRFTLCLARALLNSTLSITLMVFSSPRLSGAALLN